MEPATANDTRAHRLTPGAHCNQVTRDVPIVLRRRALEPGEGLRTCELGKQASNLRLTLISRNNDSYHTTTSVPLTIINIRRYIYIVRSYIRLSKRSERQRERDL